MLDRIRVCGAEVALGALLDHRDVEIDSAGAQFILRQQFEPLAAPATEIENRPCRSADFRLLQKWKIKADALLDLGASTTETVLERDVEVIELAFRQRSRRRRWSSFAVLLAGRANPLLQNRGVLRDLAFQVNRVVRLPLVETIESEAQIREVADLRFQASTRDFERRDILSLLRGAVRFVLQIAQMLAGGVGLSLKIAQVLTLLT